MSNVRDGEGRGGIYGMVKVFSEYSNLSRNLHDSTNFYTKKSVKNSVTSPFPSKNYKTFPKMKNLKRKFISFHSIITMFHFSKFLGLKGKYFVV